MAFCGRQQRQRLAGPHGEPGDAALELAAAAVHVDLAPHPLADPQVGELGLLEVGVDPDLGDRADGHQALPHGDVVARVDVAGGDHAVDLADHVAVAQVQLRLGEVAAGLERLASACRTAGASGTSRSRIRSTFPSLSRRYELVQGLLRRLG